MRKFYYFTAEWCGPCKTYSPVMERVRKTFMGSIDIVKVDIDERPELARDYEVVSVPTVLEVDEQENTVNYLTGAYPYNRFIDHFELNNG